MNLFEVFGTITLKDNASKEIDGLQRKISNVGDKLNGLGKKAQSTGKKMADAGKTLTKGFTVPIAGVGTATLLAASDIEKGMVEIAKSTGASGRELENFGKSFRSVFSKVPETAEEVGTALGNMNTFTGATGQELEKLTELSLKYARVNNEDVATATHTVGRLMNALDQDASELPMTLDKLTMASQMSGIGVNELANNIIDAGPSFDEMGYGLDRSIALFAKFTKIGAEPKEVISSLGKVMNNFAEDGVTNAEEAFVKLMDEIKAAPSQVEALTIANEAFGARVGGKIAEDIRSGAFEIEDWVEALQDAEGAVNSTAEETETLGEKFATLKNKASLALEPFGGVLMDAMSSFFDAAEPVLEVVSKLAEKFTELDEPVQQTIVSVGAILAISGPLLTVIGNITKVFGELSTIGSALAGLASKASEHLPQMFAGLSSFGSKVIGFAAANPLGAVLIAIGLLVGGIVTLYNTSEEFREKVNDVISSVRESLDEFLERAEEIYDDVVGWFSDTKDRVVEISQEIYTNVTEWFTDLRDSLSEKVTEIYESVTGWFSDTKEAAIDKVVELYEGVKEKFTDMKDEAIQKVKDMYDGVSKWFTDLRDGAVEKVTNMKNRITGLFTELKNGVEDRVENMKNNVKRKFERVREFMEDPVGNARKGIQKSLNRIKESFSKLKLRFPKIPAPKLPRFSMEGKFGFKPPSVPRIRVNWNAEGGIFDEPTIFNTNKGLQGVGEAGPEAILPLAKLEKWVRESITAGQSDAATMFAQNQRALLAAATSNNAGSNGTENNINVNINGDWSVNSDGHSIDIDDITEDITMKIVEAMRSRGVR